MKTEYKVIAASVMFGLLAWIIDAVLDYLVFYEGTFLELLITDVPNHELYIRSVVIACFLIFGIIMSRVMTERTQAEDVLGESEERFKVLFEFAPDAYYINDLKGNFIDGNKAAEALTGYDRSELIGESFLKLKLLPRRQIPKATALLARNALGKATGPDGFIMNRKDGSQVSVEIRTYPVQLRGQALVLGIARDITERKRAEEALRDVEQRLRLHMMHTPLAVIEWNLDFEVSAWNPGAERIFGYPAKEARGRHAAGLIVPESAQPHVNRVWEALLEKKGGERSTNENFTKNGRTILCDWYNTPLVDDDGTVIGVASLVLDITEQARAEEAMKRRNRELATLYEAGSTISSDLSLNVVLQAVAEQMTNALNSNGCTLSLWDRDQNLLRTMTDYYKDYPDETDPPGTTYNLDDYPATRHVLETRNPSVIRRDDPTADEAEIAFLEKQNVRILLMVPMITRDQVVGLIELIDEKEIREYTPGQIRLAESLAVQAAIAIENARLFEETEERRVYLEGVLKATPDAVVTMDAQHQVAEWNAGAERLFGYSREEVIGQEIDDLVTNPDVYEQGVAFTQRAMSGRTVPPTETTRYRKDGSPVDVILAGSPILVEDEVIGTVAVYTDITERVRMEEALRAMALLDELTGLYNRRGFSTLAKHQLKIAERGENKMLLLYTDMDGLKRINDSFGHAEGDRALIEIADILEEVFRASDIIARIGGDEFVVLAMESDGDSAEALTSRLREKLKTRNTEDDPRYTLSLSTGVARYDPAKPCSLNDLLDRADQAMYQQKQGNENS